MFDERVMFFSRTAGEGLEPVGVMTGAIIESPTFHTLGDTVGELTAQGLTIVDGVNKSIVGLLGEVLEHALSIEHLLRIIVIYSVLGEVHLHRLTGSSLLNAFESEI